METFYLLLTSALIAVLLFLFIWLKPDLAKKYWAYILGGLAAVVAFVILLAQRKEPVSGPDPEMQEKEEQLKTDLTQVHAEAEKVVAAARAEETSVKEEVEEISKVSDEKERLSKLSDLFNRTRR